jgi:glycine/D-amino acid oxidase-like deaminating enzyme
MLERNPHILQHLATTQPDNWWLDNDPLEPNSHQTLVGERLFDLCVVGGGYTGLWTALLAKERDPSRSVVVLEQEETGAGASGRNGGFCSASLTHGFTNGFRRFPKEIATLERMGRENLNAIEETLERYGIDCDFERTGELLVAVKPWQVKELAEEALLQNQMGDSIQILNREEVRARVNSPTYLGGTFDPNGTALVDPARLVWGLERACLALGVEIFEHSKATALNDHADGVAVVTPYGQIVAQKVALGTNAFPSLVPSARRYVVPVYDYQLASEPLSAEQRAAIGWQGREGISDGGYQFHYYRLTNDGSILWGGWDAIYHYRSKMAREYENNPEIHARLASHFLDTFPQLGDIKFTHAWSGAIDTCSRFSAFWGTAHKGRVAYVLGYTGLGVAAARFGAATMLDLLDGLHTERTELQMVRRKPVPFPPEPLRYAIIKATTRSIQRAENNGGKRNLWLRTLDQLGVGFDS